MKSSLHIGHIGLLDAAPLLVAQQQGYFVAEQLDVTLTCELGLATVCSKLADQRMDGACLPAPLTVLLSLGAGVPRVSMGAMALTCWQGLGVVLAAGRTGAKTPGAVTRIGVVSPGSPARLLLHRLAQTSPAALPGEITQVPMVASQLVEFLREQMLDGFCGNDPLPGLAQLHEGVSALADSSGLFPQHPGGVLALRTDCVEQLPHAASALARAVSRARDFCADPINREGVWRLVLSLPPYAEMESATRDRLIVHVLSGEAGWSSVSFDAPPADRAGLGAAGEVFLDNACRGAAGPSGRTLDFKGEIARVFARCDSGRLSRQKVNT